LGEAVPVEMSMSANSTILRIMMLIQISQG